MKMASQLRKFCPRCNTHTMHQISIYKKGKDRNQAQGKLRMERKTRGYGSFPKPIQKRFAKTTKKTMLKYKCADCGYTIQGKGMRLKKVDLERG